MKKTIKDIELKNKKVILRVDFNVPIANNCVVDTKRIDAAIPTIKYILENGASLIIISHLGRIKTEEDKKSKSLAIVAKKFSEILDKEVKFIPFTRGKEVEKAASSLKPGEIIFLENTRFEDLNNKAESQNDPELAKYWANLADVFVNDAFGASHRAHASTAGIAKYAKESALGFLMDDEVKHLQKILSGFERPFVAIIGGAKVSDKIKVLEKLFNIADKVLIVGGMAYTFQKALGNKIGESIYEEDKIEMAKQYLKEFKNKIVLPIDNAYVDEFADKTPLFTNKNNLNIPDGYMGLDIGPQSIELFNQIIANAKTIFWNGPAGVTEFKNFENGTKGIAIAIANNKEAYSVVGGGDSVTAINKLGYQDKFSFISTGGGASIEFIQGNKMPGFDEIQDQE
ncbi:phosphoglycerate kinase [Metamycoplasma alkalescens]|uniref:Phosphoglycerate kinase n=4 Tax=Metamycoplasma alkalescens TaxID=45363 RepID=N9U9T7_9BACT|nr:phosphoglycerate kinase [Metamycoplasma alkalescens]ENY53688.1 Phosphoglycerate kinase [Metamycoplasma alkalescens 14918]PYF42259.1 phosphoglycerate kinase [Metamycoplasma alkalescens]